MRCAYPPYAGTFFICWGDETLNMIVSSFPAQLHKWIKFYFANAGSCFCLFEGELR
uniref:Uncharacterized protein n=1 Tax=Candidatus Kentrum sp. UNK TaxID=2126344 RepID=A0A451AT99_9GAMM|nr:MAG: hypothetical protein BECKUNK1418G_GA0071005_13412 [Candidatus Kentron sp. UNK]VFK73860.1 MAG: hypothetical protein BECKUNK1418H_GA0071006_13262 [Candidatus Kentron sp. UNK]